MINSAKLINSPETNELEGVLLVIDGIEYSVPVSSGNRYYCEYLEWLAEGNTPLPPDEPDPWGLIRQKRDQLIRDSDWTMIPGATVDQAQWSAYRQILRDLPQTYSNPEDVVWPTPPSTSGPNTIEE